MNVTTLADPSLRLDRYRRRMYSPLCGLVTSIGYSLHAKGGPRTYVAGGDLCGVHALLGQEAPKAGSYHIGGSGVVPFEPAVRVYAEAAERYASSVAYLESDLPEVWAGHREMCGARGDGWPVLDPAYLAIAGTSGGPYDPFTPDAPLTWVLAPALWPSGGPGGRAACWIPAQLFYVGYHPHRHEGEPWLQAAVTTGTAVHTSHPRAIAAAAYEIIQVDATMGQWYGDGETVRITPDARTARLDALLARHTRHSRYDITFSYIPSPDLPDFSVACVIAEKSGDVPVVAVGLGADHRLERAMYKAFLEGTGVRTLAEWGLVSGSVNDPAEPRPDAMFDLDSNVAYYATAPHGAEVIERFRDAKEAGAADLPPDLPYDDETLGRHLLDAFRATGKDVYVRDITPPDVAAVGFAAVRLWCPQTLSLCLPSAPPVGHPRFAAYGGVKRHDPHPYP